MRNVILLILLTLSACKITAPELLDVEKRVVQRYQILLHLESDENLKRVFYNFNHLRMQEVRNFTEQPVQLIVSIECTDYEIDGFVEKIGNSEGVAKARRFP